MSAGVHQHMHTQLNLEFWGGKCWRMFIVCICSVRNLKICVRSNKFTRCSSCSTLVHLSWAHAKSITTILHSFQGKNYRLSIHTLSKLHFKFEGQILFTILACYRSLNTLSCCRNIKTLSYAELLQVVE